jgi:two-component system CheB/CheR fusion protein
MARQSFRGSGTPQSLVERFEGRLRALSASHVLLFHGDWRGAEVGALAGQQLAPYLSSTPPRIKLDGDAVQLSADVATPFGLVLHELATNAAKHGALAVPDGSVDLAWERVAERKQDFLHVTWTEHGAPSAPPPALDGFGTFLIDHAIPGARVEREYTADGLHCTMRFPLVLRASASSGPVL